MKTPLILFFVFGVNCLTISAQSISIHTLPIVHVAVDRPGDFYTIDTLKKIRKYNPNGEIIAESNLEKIPTLFDPWSGVRLFAFYADTREIQYLDPTLSLHSTLLVDSAFAIDPFLACPSGEYNYCLLHKADVSVKKILPRESKVQTEVYVSDFLSSPEAVLLMREYLNYLFILDTKKGIIIFNQLGIKINQLPTTANTFGFYGEELYYIENNELVFFDLYSAEIKKVPLTESTDVFLLLQDKKISIRSQQIEIADFKR